MIFECRPMMCVIETQGSFHDALIPPVPAVPLIQQWSLPLTSLIQLAGDK